jgi:cation:H+ antiporter
MSIFTLSLLLAGGLILLFVGAELLIRGSSSLALRFGISPLVVGLTVVAFGTSSPELVVSINASLDGNPAIALGNIVGSNICNIALILGIASLIRPLAVEAQVVKREIPILIAISLLMFILLLNNEISRPEGILFVSGIVVYTSLSIYLSKKETSQKVKSEFEEGIPKAKTTVSVSIIMSIGGLALLIFGSDLFVKGAVGVAEKLQLSQAIIGLTIVSLGTSLPELITSAVAAYKKEADIAIGNIVGSNIFNILAILGITATVSPVVAPDISILDLSFMLGFAFLLWPLTKTGFVLNRLEGSILLLGYLIYIYILIP